MKIFRDYKLSFESIAVLLLLLLTAGTVYMQISVSGENVTRLETTLFSVLQFIFSLSFAWLLSRATLRNEFKESQKQFAVGAYRRINEIDEGIDRLLSRIQSQLSRVSSETSKEMDVLLAIALGIRASIKSSIADWGDIIGEEIVTLEKIEHIKDEQELFLEKRVEAGPALGKRDQESEAIFEGLRKNEEKLNKLLNTLPYSLRIARKMDLPHDVLVNKNVKALEYEAKRQGFVIFQGIWDQTFEKDILGHKEGDTLYISIADVGSRVGALIAKDSVGKSVGVLTNKFESKYFVFTESVIMFLHKSSFEGEIINIERGPFEKKEDDRHQFVIKVIPPKQGKRGQA
jgi:hypothetical protein